LTYEVELSNF